MRLATPTVLLAALVLSACASTGGVGPNGWAAPADDRNEERADRTPTADEKVPPRPVARVEDVPDDRRPATASGLVIPVVGVEGGALRDSFTSPRSGGRTHNAIDIPAPRGTPLVAATDGTITRKHWNGLGGNTLYLTSADGLTDFYYAHLDSYADDVEVGTRVRRGQVLGTVGETGNARGPHLHFQVLDKSAGGRGTPVNPYDLLLTAELSSAE